MNNCKNKIRYRIFFSTWKSRKKKNELISETWRMEPKQGRGKESHGYLLLCQIPEIHALYVQKKQLVQTCSTVLVSGKMEGTNSISESATACHDLYWPLSCELTSLISLHTTHPNLYNRLQLRCLTFTDTLCFMDTMVRGAKEHNYGWNNITYTLRVYPVCVNWVYNVSHFWRLHPASEGGKFWRFTTLASLIMVIFFSGSDLIEFKINSSYDRQTWSLVHVTVCIDLYSLRRNWILCLNLRGNLLSVSLMTLFHSLSLNICESGFDFLLAYVSPNQELLQRSC